MDALLPPPQSCPADAFSLLLDAALADSDSDSLAASCHPPPPRPFTPSAHNADGETVEVHNVPGGPRRCTYCKTTTTPMWRSGPKETEFAVLCNGCGVRWRRDQILPQYPHSQFKPPSKPHFKRNKAAAKKRDSEASEGTGVDENEDWQIQGPSRKRVSESPGRSGGVARGGMVGEVVRAPRSRTPLGLAPTSASGKPPLPPVHGAQASSATSRKRPFDASDDLDYSVKAQKMSGVMDASNEMHTDARVDEVPRPSSRASTRERRSSVASVGSVGSAGSSGSVERKSVKSGGAAAKKKRGSKTTVAALPLPAPDPPYLTQQPPAIPPLHSLPPETTVQDLLGLLLTAGVLHLLPDSASPVRASVPVDPMSAERDQRLAALEVRLKRIEEAVSSSSGSPNSAVTVTGAESGGERAVLVEERMKVLERVVGLDEGVDSRECGLRVGGMVGVEAAHGTPISRQEQRVPAFFLEQESMHASASPARHQALKAESVTARAPLSPAAAQSLSRLLPPTRLGGSSPCAKPRSATGTPNGSPRSGITGHSTLEMISTNGRGDQDGRAMVPV